MLAATDVVFAADNVIVDVVVVIGVIEDNKIDDEEIEFLRSCWQQVKFSHHYFS